MVKTKTLATKTLNPKSPDVKYTGQEPDWQIQPDDTNRVSKLTAAFSWYNYHYGKKDVKDLIIEWLTHQERQKEIKEFNKVPDNSIQSTIGWLCRMEVRGLQITEHERLIINNKIAELIATSKLVKEFVAVDEPAVIKPNIQDRLKEKMSEAAGELEGMLDEMITNGVKMSADYKPLSLIRSLNVAPQLVGEIAKIWTSRLEEFQEVLAGKDADLVEGYSNFGKLELRNLVKFAETVVSDCGSYIQVKKVERKPRKKKAVSPEKLVSKFKYCKEFSELKLLSESPTKLVGASEAWLFDTKKRKLIYVVADTHIGSLTVKGTGLIGFDAGNSTMKTLRKPAEQIKALLTGGVSQHRKYFKDIKATETKYNGRGNENLILLKIR